MNYLLISPPAAGKGTIASRLKEKYNLAHISMGQLLRDVDPETDLGKKIRELQAQRILVDDSITGLLLKQRLQKEDIKNGFVLEGFPRSMAQIDLFEEICEELELTIDKIVFINISYDLAYKRTLGRLNCPNCKRIYNKFFDDMKPKVENLCDDCKIELEVRNDDNEEALKKGFETFTNETLPVVEYFRKKGTLIEFEAQNTDADTTFKRFEETVS